MKMNHNVSKLVHSLLRWINNRNGIVFVDTGFAFNEFRLNYKSAFLYFLDTALQNKREKKVFSSNSSRSFSFSFSKTDRR